MSEVRVIDIPNEQQYELTVDGERVGFLAYRDRDGKRVLLHTEVDRDIEGEGLGSRLVAGALDDIRARRLRVAAVCVFVRDFLRRHPEYADVVDA